jgi:hypothetical protein
VPVGYYDGPSRAKMVHGLLSSFQRLDQHLGAMRLTQGVRDAVPQHRNQAVSTGKWHKWTSRRFLVSRVRTPVRSDGC